jgi:hypothetical protein
VSKGKGDVLLHFGLRTLSVRMDDLHQAGDRFCDRATVAFLDVAAKAEVFVVGVRVVAFPKFGRPPRWAALLLSRLGTLPVRRSLERLVRRCVAADILSKDLSASFTAAELRKALATSGSRTTTFAPSLRSRR